MPWCYMGRLCLLALGEQCAHRRNEVHRDIHGGMRSCLVGSLILGRRLFVGLDLVLVENAPNSLLIPTWREAVVRALHEFILRLRRSAQLVRRAHPVTAPNPDRTKQTRYEIVDGYLRFYFRFMLPYESRLKTNADAERHLHETVLPSLDHFVSKPAFEEICQAFMRREEHAVAAGSWWGNVRLGGLNQTREVDVVTIDAAGAVTAIGSCKWTIERVGLDEESLLAEIEPLIPGAAPGTTHYFFGRSGFDPALEQLAADRPQKVRLVLPAQLF